MPHASITRIGKRLAAYRLRFFLLACLLLSSGCLFPSANNPSPTPILPAALPSETPSARSDAALPTPLPPLPTATLTAVPQPTPTNDPNRADWTVLVYMNADNNLESAALLDLNEMETAVANPGVNVIVQVDRALGESRADGDWTETRRYQIQPDADANAFTSPMLVALGERNLGDPQELADFIRWGQDAFPANHTALIIWDHGAGWSGVAFDDDTAAYGAPDFLSLPDLRGGLALALADGARLDVIAFDACLMGQLDVLQAVQPFADYAVASEELTPGHGWDYRTLLDRLAANSAQDGATWAPAMVADFMATYAADPFVTMTAVSLNQLPALTTAVNNLADRVVANPAQVASAVGDARSGAVAFARAYADSTETYAAVDLAHFARILAQRSPETAVVAAAQSVQQAVDAAVLSHAHGSGFKNSHGVAVYFPRNGRHYDPAYAAATAMPAWDRLLTQYHQVGQAALPPPQLRITNALRDVVGVQNPAFFEFEIAGRDVENVAILGARLEEDGSRRLLEYDLLIPEPTTLPDGTELVEWRDGVHEDFYVWRTLVTTLTDANGNAEPVVMWPTEPGSPLFTVQGRLRRNADGAFSDANLVFDNSSGALVRVWGVQGADGAAELLPQPGDEFQVYTLFWEADDTIRREPGPSFFFDENGALGFERRPLPDGRYLFGFQVENVAGATAGDFQELSVANEGFVAGYTAYLDPYLGFQFLYPEDWYPPVYDDALLYTTARADDTQLQVTIYPNLEAAVTAETLTAQTLAQFGAVDVLFADEVTVLETAVPRTAYGYTHPDKGARTGVFFTLVWDGVGYVVDLDGPQTAEAATQAAAAQIAASWQFAPAGYGLQPGQWATVDFETFSVAQPADFVYQSLETWQRFSAGRFTFVALRTQPFAGSLDSLLTQLTADAGMGVNAFVADPPFRYGLGGAVWQRVNFAYAATDESGAPLEIWGFVMVKQVGGQAVIAWAEAPRSTYNALERNVFLTMIADLELRE